MRGLLNIPRDLLSENTQGGSFGARNLGFGIWIFLPHYLVYPYETQFCCSGRVRVVQAKFSQFIFIVFIVNECCVCL